MKNQELKFFPPLPEKTEKATNLINENIGRNYKVEELSKAVGTNQHHLQEGFRILVGSTVNKYAQHQKLEAARELLKSQEYTISEIIFKIGFSNRSYFSKIFKKRYGVSPRFFQKNRKNEDGQKN